LQHTDPLVTPRRSDPEPWSPGERYDALLTALSYFNTVRPHQGIGQRTPVPSERVRASFADSVTAVPVLGGLHHEYRAAA